MKNLLLLFVIYSCCLIICIIAGVYMVIKKERFYQIAVPTLALMVILVFISYIPYTKDIIKQETTQTIVVYSRWESGDAATRELVFETGKGTVTLISPIFAKIHVKMKTGEKYKVEYYNNTKVIKSYVLVE